MIRIGQVELGISPRVVGSCAEKALLSPVFLQGADILELRIDQFSDRGVPSVREALTIARKIGVPVIATIRRREEGGRGLEEEERLTLFRTAIPLADAVDIEIESAIAIEVIKSAHQNKKIAIASYHNLQETPSQASLEELMGRGREKGGDIVKIAALVVREDDVATLAELTLKHRKENIVTIGLGRRGIFTRVFFPFIGSLLTYGYFNRPTAPGQLPVQRLQEEILRFSRGDFLYPTT